MGKSFKYGVLYTIVNGQDGRGLDNGNRTGPGQLPYMWPHEPRTPNHLWYIKHVEGDFFKIVSQHGMALDGGADRPYLWSEHEGGHNHQWRFQEVGPKRYLIVNRMNNKVLDVAHNAENPHLTVATHQSPHFEWIVRKDSTKIGFKHEKVYTISNASDGRGIDNGNRARNGELPYMWPTDPRSANHQWHLKHVEGDFYKIVSHQGLALDGGAHKPYLWNEHEGGANHQWRFVPLGDKRFQLINRMNNKALDAHGSNEPFLADPHNAHHQQWIVRKV
eukprot:TRINITY_DN14142_c0_g1_i1.p2 TRINITY_DN14142_c0_g1~~TRINITY_DN14142_c0_g1_i1.p2  ORF type:complete len:276 (+),score=83.26 TRINITY_DN14142_c0_g1_i1:122-949(+)